MGDSAIKSTIYIIRFITLGDMIALEQMKEHTASRVKCATTRPLTPNKDSDYSGSDNKATMRS